MHELKNPIAGLEMFVAGQAGATTGNGGDAGVELAAASELTRRLRTMVNDVVSVLRDEQSAATFELTCAEVVDLVLTKVQAEAAARGVTVQGTGGAELAFAGRRANLATLVLRNLAQNAIEACSRGGHVRISGGEGEGGRIEFVVSDDGPGLPDLVRARLFQPCQSAKSGGSGLGLALSQQLAQQAGGRLELVSSGPEGTSFRLVLGREA
jgi:two-component system sensor histidine kinase HydH